MTTKRAFRDFLPPEKLEQITKMAQRCASPLPWETDVTRANEKIFELWMACELAKEFLKPDLVEPGRTVFWKLVKALASAEKMEVEP